MIKKCPFNFFLSDRRKVKWLSVVLIWRLLQLRTSSNNPSFDALESGNSDAYCSVIVHSVSIGKHSSLTLWHAIPFFHPIPMQLILIICSFKTPNSNRIVVHSTHAPKPVNSENRDLITVSIHQQKEPLEKEWAFWQAGYRLPLEIERKNQKEKLSRCCSSVKKMRAVSREKKNAKNVESHLIEAALCGLPNRQQSKEASGLTLTEWCAWWLAIYFHLFGNEIFTVFFSLPAVVFISLARLVTWNVNKFSSTPFIYCLLCLFGT